MASTMGLETDGHGAATTNEPAMGMFDLTVDAHRFARRVGLAVLILPFLGVIEAIRLWFHNAVGMGELVLLAVMYFVTMGGITIGLHRLLSHRAFSTSKPLRYLLAIAGSMSGQGSVLYWVSMHRAHHAHSDAPGDPSTPHRYGDGLAARIKGFWYAHHGWLLARRVASPARLSRDLLGDRILMRINQTYLVWVILGLLIPAAVGGVMHGSWFGAWCGFIYGGLARMFLCNQAAFCVASVCHMYGSRRFPIDDKSTNNWWVALPTFGEGLQNNHHAFPSYYRHAFRWWEPDIAGYCIEILSWFGLTWDLRHPSPQAIKRMQTTAAAPSALKSSGR